PAPGPAALPAPPPPARFRVEDSPRELQPALARAEAAVKTLREQIAARLAAEIASVGVARSMAVCRRDAPTLAAAVSAQTGVEVGRIPARLRPGAPPPRPWIGPLLEETSAKRAADVAPVVVDLGDRVGLLRPVPLAASCLGCHGAADRVLPEVKLASDGGPGGFSEGDLRGFYWAEAKK
ncbi:MAG TPA: hypothetical protein VIV57_10470, partial [Anaeromyxobacter sp.]